jgi:MFS family permease
MRKNGLMIISLLLFLLFDFIQLNIISAISPYLMNDLLLSPQKLGTLSSLFLLADLILLIPAGIVLDRYTPHWIMTLSIFVAIIGLLIFYLDYSLKSAIIWRCLSGVAGAFSYLSCIKIINTYFPLKKRGILIGGTGMIIMLAGVIAQYPVYAIVKKYGLLNTLKMDIFFGVSVAVILLLCIKKFKIILKIFDSSVDFNNEKNSIYKKDNWLLALYTCLINLPLFVLGALWGSLYIKNFYHFSFEKSSLINSMIFLGNMLGAPLLGFFYDKLKKRNYLMLLASLLSFFCLITILFSNNNFILLLCMFFFLGFSSAAQALSYAEVLDTNKPFNVAKATSLLSLLSVGGGAISQPVFGWLLGEKLHYSNGIAYLIVSAFVCIIVSIIYVTQGEKNEISSHCCP